MVQSYKEMSSPESRVSQVSCASWRRLHTDSCILASLANLSETSASRSISILDRAIIISGAAGHGRLDLVLSIITHIQGSYFTPRTFSAIPPQPPARAECKKIETAGNQIRCLSAPPSFNSFQSEFAKHPFILRGYASGWPAMREHPWRSAQYLRFVSGPGRVVPVEVGSDYRSDDWTQDLVDWDRFLSSLDFPDQPVACDPDRVLYLAQHNLLMQFPDLRSDIIIPDYVYAALTHSDFPDYKPPGNEEQLVINAWLGPKGTISPAHTVRAQ